jgi:hypothetical protein
VRQQYCHPHSLLPSLTRRFQVYFLRAAHDRAGAGVKHSTRVVRGLTRRPRPDTTPWRDRGPSRAEGERVALHHIKHTAWSNPTA